MEHKSFKKFTPDYIDDVHETAYRKILLLC